MPSTDFTPAEFAGFAASLNEANQKAIAHGYNSSGLLGAGCTYRNDADGETYTISIDEADDKSTITTNLTAATLPTALSVVTASQTVTADGVDTVTFDLDGELSKAVTLTWTGSIVVDKRSLTLDGSGDGSFVVGPYAAGHCTDANGYELNCAYSDGSGDAVTCHVVVGV